MRPVLGPKGNDRGSSLAMVLMVTVLLSALVLSQTVGFGATRGLVQTGRDHNRARYVARAAFERACHDELAGTAAWNNLPTDALDGVAFGGCEYDLHYDTFAGLADSVQVRAAVTCGDRTDTLVFLVSRPSFGGPITLWAVEDHSLELWLGRRTAS